ncbi:MAG: ABC transporter permease [Lachnospiraceae bacterium]|nr:ABC transporter permease [Lachnospiraceae bacterium]
MKEIYVLVKRNILIFIRDRASVFFSVLSMLIVLMLMAVFLGNMNTDNTVEVLEQYGGIRNATLDRENAKRLISMWTLAGVLLVNCVTVPMTVMGNMVTDEMEGRLAAFYVTPVKRSKIATGYILASWLIGIVLCLLTFGLGQGYLAACGISMLNISDCAALAGMIFLNTFLYSAVAYLLALFIHSSGAWSGMLTVIGTLVGFVGAIYLPVGMLPEKIVTVLKAFPVLHGAAMMRSVCTRDSLAATFAGLPTEVSEIYQSEMGITISLNEQTISDFTSVFFVIGLSAAVTVAAFVVSKYRAGRDR